MQRIKTVLIVLAIVVLSATSFKCIAQAAQVTKVFHYAGGVYVDGGEQEGFTVGSTVCFYSKTGEHIVCGKVVTSSSWAPLSRVWLGKNATKLVGRGTEALLYIEEEGGKEKEGIKEEKVKEEKEQVKEQAKKIDQQRVQEKERIKKEDWFR